MSSLPQPWVPPDSMPVRGLVDGAAEARLLGEGLQEHGPVTVALLPVVAEALPGRCAPGWPWPDCDSVPRGQDQEARVVDGQVQALLALANAPADEGIAGLALPGRRAEAEPCDD